MNPEIASRRLAWHGLVVFLLGLGSGLAMLGAAGAFQNHRLALAAHLVGVTGGMFLVLAGLLLDKVRLTSGALAAACWLLLYGAYGNWLATLLGALFGTRTLTPLAASGTGALFWKETMVGFLLTTSGTATLAACAVLLWGLRARVR